ncbi:MAG: hypothetical protein ABI570_05240 [Ilumatobacteraceae bacterium]
MTSPAQDNDPHQIVPTLRDPVRNRREKISRWTQRAMRVGYLCFAISIIAVGVGVLWEFKPFIGSIATVSLIAGCVLLAPAIVLGYAVKAAEREDKQNGR